MTDYLNHPHEQFQKERRIVPAEISLEEFRRDYRMILLSLIDQVTYQDLRKDVEIRYPDDPKIPGQSKKRKKLIEELNYAIGKSGNEPTEAEIEDADLLWKYEAGPVFGELRNKKIINYIILQLTKEQRDFLLHTVLGSEKEGDLSSTFLKKDFLLGIHDLRSILSRLSNI